MTIALRRGATCVTVLLAGGLVAACSNSEGPDTAGPDASGTSSGRAGSSVAAAAPASSSGRPADPATKRQITSAFTDFFDSRSTTAKSQAALQHGEAFTATLEEQAKGSYSRHSGVEIGAVAVRGEVADVTFTIISSGAPLLSNVKGFAVREDGRWKVAATTFCALLTLEGSPPAACSDASITSLPQ